MMVPSPCFTFHTALFMSKSRISSSWLDSSILAFFFFFFVFFFFFFYYKLFPHKLFSLDSKISDEQWLFRLGQKSLILWQLRCGLRCRCYMTGQHEPNGFAPNLSFFLETSLNSFYFSPKLAPASRLADVNTSAVTRSPPPAARPL